MCKSKLTFPRLLEKLIQNCGFGGRNKRVKQVDGCLMAGAISVIMSAIHMNRLEKERVMTLNQNFINITLMTLSLKERRTQILLNSSRTCIHTIQILN